jgi:hypothetical protein
MLNNRRTNTTPHKEKKDGEKNEKKLPAQK